MAEQTSTACASTKGPPADDPFEKAKKKVQEVSNIAIAQLGALVPDEWDHLKKRVNEVSASGKAGQVSWGCCTGLCAGFALKKASKVGAVAIGALLGLLYGACSSGYVNVDAEKLGRDFRRYLDIHQVRDRQCFVRTAGQQERHFTYFTICRAAELILRTWTPCTSQL